MKLIITLELDNVSDDAPKGEDLDNEISAMLDDIVVEGYEIRRKHIRRDWQKEPRDEVATAMRELSYLIRDAGKADLRMSDLNPMGYRDEETLEVHTVAQEFAYWLEIVKRG